MLMKTFLLICRSSHGKEKTEEKKGDPRAWREERRGEKIEERRERRRARPERREKERREKREERREKREEREERRLLLVSNVGKDMTILYWTLQAWTLTGVLELATGLQKRYGKQQQQ